MGYRTLLKRYIRHLRRMAGDHYIGVSGDDETLSKRERAELQLLAAEVEREESRSMTRRAIDAERSRGEPAGN